MSVAQQIASRHFGRKMVSALSRKGIRVIGLQALPDMSSSMPYANASTGYIVDDNGCGRIWTHREVTEAAR
jgi:hypothetical protein